MCNREAVEALVQRAQNGDEEAAGELYVRYANRLLKLASNQISQRLRRRFDAEDAVQSAFKSFFRCARKGEFAIDQSVAVWQLLLTITMNKIRRKARDHRAAKRDVGLEVHARGRQTCSFLVN